jgi:hypothetical protein
MHHYRMTVNAVFVKRDIAALSQDASKDILSVGEEESVRAREAVWIERVGGWGAKI